MLTDGVPPWPKKHTNDTGFVRISTSSDRTEMFIKKYLKTKKLEHFGFRLIIFEHFGYFPHIWGDVRSDNDV